MKNLNQKQKGLLETMYDNYVECYEGVEDEIIAEMKELLQELKVL